MMKFPKWVNRMGITSSRRLTDIEVSIEKLFENFDKKFQSFLRDMSDMELLTIEQDVEQLIENFDSLSHHNK